MPKLKVYAFSQHIGNLCVTHGTKVHKLGAKLGIDPARAVAQDGFKAYSCTLYCRHMRILVNFMNRDGWSVHCMAPDCQTLISQWVTVRTEETLLRLLKASGATPPRCKRSSAT
jgi:hypothetical protein